jgi:phage anti-repressor protein|nr:MAG TPA: AntA/AntB antirepressor [Bacteriophage sp.]
MEIITQERRKENLNEVEKAETRTPIEIALDIDSEGMTTARKLYEFLGLNPSNYSKWCKANIIDNEFATENEDYWVFVPQEENPLGGRPTTDYRLTAHFAKKLSVKGNGEKAEQAREYFTVVEERVKQTAIDRTQLSPQLQLMNMLVENMSRQELESKRQAEQITKVESTVNNIKEIFTQPIGDWKAEINARIREISIKSGIDYQTLYNEMYGRLETIAHCSLKRLQDNKTARMEKAGNTKTAIREGTTKIAIIYEKPQLKAIFEDIVKRYAMAYA